MFGIFGTIWYALFLPETTGKSLEEITDSFRNYSRQEQTETDKGTEEDYGNLTRGVHHSAVVHNPLHDVTRPP